MPVVKTVKSRGATVVIEANAEVLFLPPGLMARFNRSLSNRVRYWTAKEAPKNKRPRWSHYGAPLKSTVRSSTQTNPAKTMAFTAVGATAAHALFVDQGTKSFAAKILPPWTRGGASLYEHTWRPSPGSPPVGKIIVRGQAAQRVMEAGLKRGIESTGVATHKEFGSPAIARAEALFPPSLTNFRGGTPFSMRFDAQLREWRIWKDTAWRNEGRLGEAGRQRSQGSRDRYQDGRFTAPKPRRRSTEERKRELNRQRQQRWRDRHPDMKRKRKSEETRAETQERVVAEFRRRNPQITRTQRTPQGLIIYVPGFAPQRIPWSRIYAAQGLTYRG